MPYAQDGAIDARAVEKIRPEGWRFFLTGEAYPCSSRIRSLYLCFMYELFIIIQYCPRKETRPSITAGRPLRC